MKRIKDLRTRALGNIGVDHDTAVSDAIREFVDKDISCLTVYEHGKFVGMFTKNDLVRACMRHPEGIGKLKVADCMKTNLYTTDVHDDLDEVVDEMLKRGFRHVPVLDGDEVVGMVTPIDILLHLRHEAEEERAEMVRFIQGSY